MKKFLIVLLLAFVVIGCKRQSTYCFELTDWQFDYDGVDYPASVPGFVHTDLMANGIIGDPYMGTNEDSVQWVSQCKWTYTCHIDRSILPKGDSLWIVFEGLAGRADVVFYDDIHNAKQVVSHEADNMFVSYEFPLPAFCNDIMVQFYPLYDSVLEQEYGIPLPDRRAFTRIAPYQQGWDWGPKLVTCGIWKKVFISGHRRTGRTCQTSRTCHTGWNVELQQENDSIGQSFTFYKDGKPVFMKGANWIPVHSFPVLNEAMKERYRHLLCSAKEANFNMIRVWGGGIYEHDYFYDLCDSLGIMVWQDFNFSTMLYPDNPKMLESIKREAYENVTRIAQHPCVVVWCGNNEVKNGWEDWGWQGVYNWTTEQRTRLQHGIDTIFGDNGILAQAVSKCDPQHRPYITTSPLYGWGHPECVTHGDSHYWGVWWGEEPFEMYKEKTGRFMSEYGFQSYPEWSTVCRFCPKDERNIDSPTIRRHQKHGRGRQIIDKAMMEYYGVDSRSLSLEDYCYVSQLLQAWGTGYGILQHLLAQPHCMGTLYWQLNDCWPVASWSSIDYYGNWKALHYRVQALYDENVNLGYWEKYYSVYPKDLKLTKPDYKLIQRAKNGVLTVTVSSNQYMRDVMLETVPHIDGHFEHNYFDIEAGNVVETRFIPRNKNADLSNVEVTLKCLNDLMVEK